MANIEISIQDYCDFLKKNPSNIDAIEINPQRDAVKTMVCAVGNKAVSVFSGSNPNFPEIGTQIICLGCKFNPRGFIKYI